MDGRVLAEMARPAQVDNQRNLNMNTSNAHWNSMIGKRALFSELSLPPHEDRVMEVSPSGHHVRFEKNGWEGAASYTLVELLAPAASDVVDVVAVCDKLAMTKAADFTPEEVADLPNNVDFEFSPEVLADAREPRIPCPTDFSHSRFEALCSSINNM
jgi:hypothetical protein